MIERTFYDTSGKILGYIASDDEQTFTDNEPSGSVGWVEGLFSPNEYYVKNGAAVPYPPKAYPYLVFNHQTEQWDDPRTQADYDAYVLATRTSTVLGRAEFCKSLMNGGPFTHEELISFVVGYFNSNIRNALIAAGKTADEIV